MIVNNGKLWVVRGLNEILMIFSLEINFPSLAELFFYLYISVQNSLASGNSVAKWISSHITSHHMCVYKLRKNLKFDRVWLTLKENYYEIWNLVELFISRETRNLCCELCVWFYSQHSSSNQRNYKVVNRRSKALSNKLGILLPVFFSERSLTSILCQIIQISIFFLLL
jgi:hypothetical protein